MEVGMGIRERIAKRAAKELKDGMIVNLGIGIPSLIPNFLPKGMRIMFQAENGILGMGESPDKGKEDANLCNAAGYPVTIVDGASYFDSATAFAMIRKGLIDVTVLGGLQVSEQGDLANWMVPGKRVPGVGGGMELAQKTKKVIVVMSHVSKDGEPKIVTECSLPLTARQCVHLIITDQAVIEVTKEGLLLTEVMAPYNVEDVVANTGAFLQIAPSLKRIE
ncbi:3-oxoacid CoA-transferase subunit B [Anoxybacillus rupiensis]|uniref:3-oxoacid CoA-transferase subunit B n=1 Tax=Anoxybacteroides rupiense TaxID=311460 RepID=A0ABD5ITW7_9BACL|nr:MULTISPECIES: 3-oxoacid CoA-transferase subunit B [Anoxybacillus]MBS2771791.1 CoA transferase subunit B [Anoxybacillus rupiensis]MDE8563843.1 3-oxoacid CoA-transferase subunit B [Anoxybacillus rupiensis]MED5051437.1 3-oxoacid CoA-transferase subunit B [Anoxybacillus rupiensis]OQM46038.1 acyl CoA:acetate/3-ketoacid CoA transferase subunit beta [Anoxybacillus sp. UARK-01]QHC04245.1 3-oxoacid CoA-transferase subunit B [Anoxybacillus sp. PDR2]